MGSVERKQRLREEVKGRIIDASWKIVQEEGWHALSMRRIADAIEYTAPIIYGYFKNKEAILFEFTAQGYGMLSHRILEIARRNTDPALKLEAVWLAYWDFAFEHQAHYQLMYGVEMDCGRLEKLIPEMEEARELTNQAVKDLIADSKDPQADPCRTFYTFWAVVHGLISLNLVRKTTLSQELNRSILRDAIRAIIAAVKSREPGIDEK